VPRHVRGVARVNHGSGHVAGHVRDGLADIRALAQTANPPNSAGPRGSDVEWLYANVCADSNKP
jgi:hypothetical protein